MLASPTPQGRILSSSTSPLSQTMQGCIILLPKSQERPSLTYALVTYYLVAVRVDPLVTGVAYAYHPVANGAGAYLVTDVAGAHTLATDIAVTYHLFPSAEEAHPLDIDVTWVYSHAINVAVYPLVTEEPYLFDTGVAEACLHVI